LGRKPAGLAALQIQEIAQRTGKARLRQCGVLSIMNVSTIARLRRLPAFAQEIPFGCFEAHFATIPSLRCIRPLAPLAGGGAGKERWACNHYQKNTMLNYY